MRYRLVALLLALHLGSSLLAGGLTVWWQRQRAAEERRERASAIAAVLARGGFSTNPQVLERMAELAGTPFRIVSAEDPKSPDALRVRVGLTTIEVGLPEDRTTGLGAGSVVAFAVFVIGGSGLFALAALWTARSISRPVERLARAAEAIGEGGLGVPVPVVGSGEVARLAASLERMRGKLEELEARTRRHERLAVLGTFSASIAHEVRNPLSAIRLIIQGARQRPDAAAMRVAEEEIERLDLVVDGLLAWARGWRLDPAPCALHDLADGVLRLLDRQSRHAGVTLERHGEAVVVGDALRLRQLLFNLVINAIQAQPEGGAVEVHIHPDGLAVYDHGPGVDPALLDGEPFTTTRADGTGLGLHLARAIAEAHGARLRCGTRSSGGAEFVLAGLAQA